jgi:hypothetical protein
VDSEAAPSAAAAASLNSDLRVAGIVVTIGDHQPPPELRRRLAKAARKKRGRT